MTERGWDRAALGLLGAVAAVMAATFTQYGISNDEWLQHEYGKRLLAFYTSGFADLSAFSFRDLYLYGGLFDLVVAVLAPLSPVGEYDTRHLLSAAAGWLGLLGTWRLGRLAFGARAGFLALVLLTLTGAWYGAQFTNTKDVPFAAAMVWLLVWLCHVVRGLSKPGRGAVVMLGLTAGLALGQRVGAVLWVAPLAVGLALRAWEAGRPGEGLAPSARRIGEAMVALLPAVLVALPVTAVFWPWVVMAPWHLADAAAVFSHHPSPIETVLDGTAMWSRDVPATYLHTYLLVKLPELALVGLAAFAVLLALARRPWVARGAVWPVMTAALFPLVLVLAIRPHLYNGIRHFLFVLPPLLCLAGAGLDRLLALLEARVRPAATAAGLAMAALGTLTLSDLVRLHPYQYVDYNLLIGDLTNAEDHWEMDYWSAAIPELLSGLTAFLRAENRGQDPARPVRIWVCAEPIQTTVHAPPFLVLEPDIARAQFALSSTHLGCDNWIKAPVVVTVERMGARLGVVKDLRGRRLF